MEEFSLEMQFEIDVFWVNAAGLAPVELNNPSMANLLQI